MALLYFPNPGVLHAHFVTLSSSDPVFSVSSEILFHIINKVYLEKVIVSLDQSKQSKRIGKDEMSGKSPQRGLPCVIKNTVTLL